MLQDLARIGTQHHRLKEQLQLAAAQRGIDPVAPVALAVVGLGCVIVQALPGFVWGALRLGQGLVGSAESASWAW
jgi:hypothetical protein